MLEEDLVPRKNPKDFRTLFCLTVVAGLAGLIVLSLHRLLQLREAETLLAEAVRASHQDDAGVALAVLLDRLPASLSSSQEERRNIALTNLVRRALARDCPLRKIGRLAYEPGRQEPYRFGGSRVTLVATLEPPALGRSVRALVVDGEEVPFEGMPPAANVALDLPPGGTARRTTVGFLLVLPGGEKEEISLPGGLAMVQDLRGPELRVEAGSSSAQRWQGRVEETPTLKVPSGAPLRVQLRDGEGLSRVRWQVDGQDQTRRFLDSERTREFDLPLDPWLTETSSRRLVRLRVEAENRIGNSSSLELRVDVRMAGWHPVREVRIGSRALRSDGLNFVAGIRPTVLLVVEPADLPEARQLTLRVAGKEYAIQEVDGGLEAEVELRPDKPTGILLLRGESVLASYQVQADSNPPRIVLKTSAGEVLEPGPVALPGSSQLILEIDDSSGLDPAGQEVDPGLLEELTAGNTPRTLRRAYVLPEDTETRLEVRARDSVGNQTPTLHWSLQAERRFSVERLLLGGQPPGEAEILLLEGSALLEVFYAGRGQLKVSVFGDGDGSVAIYPLAEAGELPWCRDLDLLVPEGSESRRTVEVQDQHGTSLGRFQVCVDRAAPRLAVLPTVRWDQPEPTCAAGPGGLLTIVATDASGVPELTVDGAEAGAPEIQDDRTVLNLVVPEDLPRHLQIRARDRAGRQTLLAFRLLDPAQAEKVDIHLFTPEGTRTSPGRFVVPEAGELMVLVENGLLEDASLHGQCLPLAPWGGWVPKPVLVPGTSVLVLRVRDSVGREQVHCLSLVILPSLASQQARLDRAREELHRGNTQGALEMADALLQDLIAEPPDAQQGDPHRRLVEEVEALRRQAQPAGPVGPGTPPPPARIINARDGAELLLVRPRPEGPDFRAMHFYRTEVTVGMYRRFLEEVGGEPSWWASLEDPLHHGRIRRPEEERESALRLVDARMKPERPVVGLGPVTAIAYARWAAGGLPSGELGIPTAVEWCLAAGRALHPAARYPATGSFPDGSDLGSRLALGVRGGAAFGYRITQPLQLAGSYAPGAFGLLDMAGSAWEWVRSAEGEWMILGGGHSSEKEECQLDAAIRQPSPALRSLVGLRLVWRP